MTHRGRRTWAATVIGAAVLAAVTLLAVQGCAPAAPADAVTHAVHDVSVSQAQAVYRSYVAASDAAAAQGNATKGLALVTAAQWAQVNGQYTTLATAGTAVPRYQYGRPVFYVPAQDNYPYWFVVAVPRKTVEKNGHAGAPVNTLLLFERGKRSVPWTLGGSAVLGQALPGIAFDGGYAIAVSTTDPALLLRPDVVGATQAAVVDDGPASPAAAVVGGGPETTGLYAAQAAQARSAAAQGLQYNWLLEGAPFWEFGLRLKDGGALVLYGMYLNTTTEHKDLAAGPPIQPPAGFSPLFAAPTEIGYHAVYANWTYQFAAIDPAATAHDAKLRVIAAQAGPSLGHAY